MKQPFASICAVALGLALTMAGTASQAAVVTFDPVDEQGLTLAAGDAISAQGFRFTQINDSPALLFAGETAGAYASNGSSTLFAGNQADLRLTLGGGARFDLASLSFGGGNLGDVSTWATELLLSGLTADNQLLTRTVLIDSSFFGLTDLSLNWLNLTQVDIRVTAGDYSLDDLSLQAVPEPTSWALTGVALLGLTLTRRKRPASSTRV